MQPIHSQLLAEVEATLRRYKELGERAMAQVDDARLTLPLAPEGNSIAVLVRHLGGNMRSRWTDFLTTDGEKPDRDRDAEFELEQGASRDEILGWWEAGWGSAFATLATLRPEDVERTVTIRGEPHTVLQALLRQVTHAAYHVGQMVMLAKHFRGEAWETLSIPRRRAAAAPPAGPAGERG